MRTALSPGQVTVLRAVASLGKVSGKTKVASGVARGIGDLANELTPEVGHAMY